MPEREDRDRWSTDRRAALALRTWQGPPVGSEPHRPVGGRVRELADEMRRRQLATLLQHSPDATIIVDGTGVVCEWNPAAEDMLGRQRAEAVGNPLTALVPDAARRQFDLAWTELASGKTPPASLTSWIRPDGLSVDVTTTVASIRSGAGFGGAVAIIREGSGRAIGATSQPGNSSGAEHLAPGPGSTAPHPGVLDFDELTGLPGRHYVQRRLAAPVPAGMARGVAFVDADGFALVNEAFGPDAGDQVLQDLAQRLTGAAAGGGDLGRWQAGSFAWIVDAVDPVVALDGFTERLSTALDRPFALGDEKLWLTASAGLVTGELAPDTDLLTAAMDALRVAKDSGRNRAVWYLPEHRTGSGGRFRLANDLHRGIENGELRLHFQPIVDLATDAVVGVEALVRWQRPGVGLLGPVSFIATAERTGQIVALGAWVAGHACAAAEVLARRPDGPLQVSINLSARQLSDPGIVEMLRTAIADAGCPPSMLVAEVTETALTYDFGATVGTLETIKSLGVGLDLDDFGTGYSSLLYLRHFPVDRIKIDQSFVAGLGSSSADTAIVASTIALAHSIGLGAIAEGVETTVQLDVLRAMGCDFAQGYLLCRPVDLEALVAYLDERVPDPALTPVADTLAGDLRERTADVRDGRADSRDGLADVRDDLADTRDEVAAARDLAADARDVRADVREGAGGEPTAARGPDAGPGPEGTTVARRRDRSGRERASRKRGAEAIDRLAAGHVRDEALADRASDATERLQAEVDRSAAATLQVAALQVDDPVEAEPRP